MAGFAAHKLAHRVLLSLSLALICAAPAFGEEQIACKVNEEHDSKGRCCTDDLMETEDGRKRCFEAPGDMAIAAAFTLIGSFTFLISLNFGMNWPDEDMQKYAYKVISQTVSIFSAVLMFQCINGLLEDWIVEPFKITGWSQFFFNFGHMILWYIITQFVVAWASGALKPEKYRSNLLKQNGPMKTVLDEEKETILINCNCFGGVLAHLTGFASINAWTTLQEQKPFNSDPLMALVPVVFATLGQIFLQRLTGWCRVWWIKSDDDQKDWFESRWDEACDDAEDDVMGLTLSVIIVNTLRMLINGLVRAGAECLPNQEQKEEGEKCEDFVETGQRTFGQIFLLFVAASIFVVLLFLQRYTHDRIFNRAASESEEGDEREKPWYEEMAERYTDVFMITLSMAFSWCLFHGNKQFLTWLNPSFLGNEKNECSLAVVLALELTYISSFVIKLLDWIADLPDRWTPPAIDDSIKVVIDAISVCIGFAWEQTFDVSVDTLANSIRPIGGKKSPAFAKFAIGSLCCSVVFLAWKWYILPFVVKEGWKFGFVFTGSDLYHTAQKVAESDPDFKARVLPDLQAKFDKAVVRGGRRSFYAVKPGDEICNMQEKQQMLESLQRAKKGNEDHAQENNQLRRKLLKTEAEKEKLQREVMKYMQSTLGSLKVCRELRAQTPPRRHEDRAKTPPRGYERHAQKAFCGVGSS